MRLDDKTCEIIKVWIELRELRNRLVHEYMEAANSKLRGELATHAPD